jgi:Fic family protein
MNDKYSMSIEENIFLAKKALVGSIYDAARLEGVNATFPETAAILDGVNVQGVTLDDVQVILNLRNAWRFILSNIKTAKIDFEFIAKINENVSHGQSLEWGKLRNGRVGVAGTNHKPAVPNKRKVIKDIRDIVDRKSNSTTEKALDLMLYIMYNQLFWDGNKRTAALTANALLVQNGVGILSVTTGDIVEFNRLLTLYYNTSKAGDLKQFLYNNSIDDLASVGEIDVPLNVPESVPLNSSEIAVLSEISHDPFATYDKIAAQIGKNRKTVQRAIVELKSRGIISRQGSDKTGHWVIRRENSAKSSGRGDWPS